jgi:hypothetical protein
VANPGESVPFLQRQLQPVSLADTHRIPGWLRDLDSDEFAVRQKAAQELERLGDAAEPSLQRTLQDKPSPEVRARVEQFLAKLDWASSPERLRLLRAIEALEHIGTPEAKAVLKTLADGAPEARLTREAKASLDRLAKRSAP